jgi:small-conductance mechanosensitive channel
MVALRALLETSFLDNTLLSWAAAGTAALGLFLGAALSRMLVRRRLRSMQATERIELLELPFQVVSRTATVSLLVLSLCVALRMLTLAPSAARAVTVAFTVVGFWQLGMWGSAAVGAWLSVRRKDAVATDRASAGSLGIIGVILRGLVSALILLLALDNLGVDITALVAGLGVGGIAVALAVQNVLGDLFASLSITLDRPFVLGDFVVLGDFMGSVEHIGIKSTRLRSLGGEQIVLSNADLLTSRLRNYGRMVERRVVFSFGVTYETDRAALREIPQTVRRIVEAQPETRFDRCHFAKYGDFALAFEAVYYVLSPDYNRFMDVQQEINLDLYASFEDAHIQFAYPTQKLFLAQAQVGDRSSV